MDCFLSSHYHTETRSNKLHAVMRADYLLSEVYNIAYHAAWWYSELRLNRTPQFYDIHRQWFQRFPGYISLTLSYWFQSLTADFRTMFLSAQSWSWNILAGDQMIKVHNKNFSPQINRAGELTNAVLKLFEFY